MNDSEDYSHLSHYTFYLSQDYSLPFSISLSSSLMASSSFTSRNYIYSVFASFHGPDVRKTLLSHIREQFTHSGITMFDDQAIARSATIAPSLTEAIKESRISIVILSKNYASSSWCLNELVEILERKKAMGQIVMTIFYGVDPSDVRKQTGEFGIAFNETCASKTDEERQKWSKALNEVGNIAGEDFLRWSNEAKMIKKIARDVSNKLNATPSRDFDGMVGLEAHLREMESLLDFDDDGVKVVAISGPAGIGKTTIARAIHSLHSYRFQLTCFVDNLRGSYPNGFDEYGLKLRLQEEFLSNILKQDGIRICHLGVIEERLHDQRVLIILDDVNNIKQLEALAGDISWFGRGSRVVVTTENKELLQQHGINNTYHVEFPSRRDAHEILCRYAFKQSYPHAGFEELALQVTDLCGNLPLGLRVVGSSLRGKKEDEWEDVMNRLESVLDRDIEEVLRVGYESLDENEQTLFLHIAVFLNYEDGNIVKTMFDDGDLDVKHGLKVLENRSLIELYDKKETIKMHRLLQQMGIKAIHKQEPWKRRILIDAPEICDVLEHAKGTRVISGISFDTSDIDEVSISPRAFRRMPKLRFLRVYKSKEAGNDVVHIPEDMEFPRRLRLLHWEAYPNKCLHPSFHPEYLVKLDMQDSQLEYLLLDKLQK
ncbi:disease resistance protein RML1B-like [Raphanus sativus]|uniref:ADP-ribosyl cyclase/cyclic ADP-ribose hydrolase n=1 Tax=Raphanus sativus TaxID=3726 RepID=A0A6J0L3F9_RAPSA|nr:disease resistance protein RML1B-like [Raphanus sativus]